jgi:hypothetical protein
MPSDEFDRNAATFSGTPASAADPGRKSHLRRCRYPIDLIIYALSFLVLPIFGQTTSTKSGASVSPFLDVQPHSGINFKRLVGNHGGKELVETIGGGVALFDYNGDGLLDIFLVNGADTPSLAKNEPRYFNRLYRNDGGFHFTDVTLTTGVQGTGYGMGAAVGDYDNDGFPDLYVTNFGKNELYHNRRDGTFVNVTKEAGVEAGGWSTSAAFLDYDRDGYLDLFVSRYVNYDIGMGPTCGDRARHLVSYCFPDLFQPATNLLYHNNGDGTFRDVSRESGIGGFNGRGLGVAVGDFDGDGWPDIFVANDRSRNFLFRNKGDGTFEEVALPAGVAYSADGSVRAGMGTDFGDYNGDGWPDILVANFETEGLGLFQNVKGKYFLDVEGPLHLRELSFPYVSFGAKFLDYDNDGSLDIFVANGHTQDDIASYKPDASYSQPKLLFQNRGGQFSLVHDDPAGPLSQSKVSRGAAFGDLDNDGAVDIVVNNTSDYPQILKNEIGAKNHSLILKLVGAPSNRDGIGTKIEVHCGTSVQFLEVQSAGSYMSANDTRSDIGLGSCGSADEIKLRWPSGVSQTLRAVRSGFLYVVSEDKGIVHVTGLKKVVQ